MTSTDTDRLLCQCADEPNELLRRGIAEFNAQRFFEQHETLESAWRNEAGPVRALYQGILQVGVAYYHIRRSNYIGALKVFERAWAHLIPLPAVCCTIDVAGFIANSKTAQAELLRLGPERIAEFNPVFFKSITLVDGIR